MAREFRVTSALAGTGIPVPAPVVLCEDESVIGVPFTVAVFVEGRTVQSRTDVDELDDPTLTAVVDRLVEALAALHAVDHAAAGLEGLGRPGRYAERQVRRWIRQWELVGVPRLSRLADDLGSRLSVATFEQRATSVVHGDYRIDNTILVLDPRPTVAAIVDWELATIGDPVADVAMMCVYRDPALDLVLGIESAWSSDRLPDPDQLAEAYCEAGGVALVDWAQHLALGYFKLAVIAAGIDHRYRAGATRGDKFTTAGDAVEPLLEEGLRILRRGRGARQFGSADSRPQSHKCVGGSCH